MTTLKSHHSRAEKEACIEICKLPLTNFINHHEQANKAPVNKKIVNRCEQILCITINGPNKSLETELVNRCEQFFEVAWTGLSKSLETKFVNHREQISQVAMKDRRKSPKMNLVNRRERIS